MNSLLKEKYYSSLDLHGGDLKVEKVFDYYNIYAWEYPRICYFLKIKYNRFFIKVQRYHFFFRKNQYHIRVRDLGKIDYNCFDGEFNPTIHQNICYKEDFLKNLQHAINLVHKRNKFLAFD